MVRLAQNECLASACCYPNGTDSDITSSCACWHPEKWLKEQGTKRLTTDMSAIWSPFSQPQLRDSHSQQKQSPLPIAAGAWGWGGEQHARGPRLPLCHPHRTICPDRSLSAVRDWNQTAPSPIPSWEGGCVHRLGNRQDNSGPVGANAGKAGGLLCH